MQDLQHGRTAVDMDERSTSASDSVNVSSSTKKKGHKKKKKIRRASRQRRDLTFVRTRHRRPLGRLRISRRRGAKAGSAIILLNDDRAARLVRTLLSVALLKRSKKSNSKSFNNEVGSGGPRSLAASTTKENAKFFQDIFEIGRRNKVLNPSRMRANTLEKCAANWFILSPVGHTALFHPLKTFAVTSLYKLRFFFSTEFSKYLLWRS